MKQLLSPKLVKQSLSSHSWIGLLVGVFMYLICLSGTVAVLYPDFERWEQADAPEYARSDPAALDRAYQAMMDKGVAPSHHVYLSLATEDMPRTTISTETEGWFVNADGTLGAKVAHDWTHLLINLHNYLHLPGAIGMIVVSAMGALLCALIISGFLSHPSIFKDAFSFRRQGSRRLEQVDLHNRLSVWGAPFHLMIAITGAFFGLAGVYAIVADRAFSDDGGLDVTSVVYGAEPELQQEARLPAVGAAVDFLMTTTPDTDPFFLTVERADEPEHQYMIIGTRHRDRLIWGEQYRFDAAGNYLDKIGYADGAAGRQSVFSIYRLHFGHFSGWIVKAMYIVFGLALTVVSVSGINIWLARRKTRDALNNLWPGLVWGAPLALAVTAVSTVLLNVTSVAMFWLVLSATMGLMHWLDDTVRGKAWLQLATGALLGILVLGHVARFGSPAFGPAALVVNVSFMATAVVFLAMGWQQYRKQAVSRPRAAVGEVSKNQY
jgi:uncharacterized iron-regulated membrane protein